MADPNCSYHPDTNAVSRCERCSRLICARDKVIYRKHAYTGTGKHRYRTTETYEYCVVCKSEATINDVTGPGAILGYIGGFIVVLIFISTATSIGAPGYFMLFGLIFLVVLGYQAFSAPKKADQARKTQANFLRSLDNNPTGISSRPKSGRVKSYTSRKRWSDQEIFCFECESKIEMSDDFCKNCGDSTVDERKALMQSKG